MKHICYQDPNFPDVLAIAIPTAEGIAFHKSLANWIKATIPADISYTIVEETDIPKDRIFRNAWALSNNKPVVDIPKAKQIAHAIRREVRMEELKPLDVLATIPEQAAEAERSRKAIRDKHAVIQTEIDNANTEQELKELLNPLISVPPTKLGVKK